MNRKVWFLAEIFIYGVLYFMDNRAFHLFYCYKSSSKVSASEEILPLQFLCGIYVRHEAIRVLTCLCSVSLLCNQTMLTHTNTHCSQVDYTTLHPVIVLMSFLTQHSALFWFGHIFLDTQIIGIISLWWIANSVSPVLWDMVRCVIFYGFGFWWWEYCVTVKQHAMCC